MSIGYVGPYLRHLRIESECLLEVGKRLVVGLPGRRFVPELGPGLTGVIDGLEVLRPAARGALALRLLELEVEGACNLPGHLRLEGEQILGAPVEAFRPEVRARLRIDELGVHAHLALGTSHTALEDVADTQLPAEMPH